MNFMDTKGHKRRGTPSFEQTEGPLKKLEGEKNTVIGSGYGRCKI